MKGPETTCIFIMGSIEILDIKEPKCKMAINSCQSSPFSTGPIIFSNNQISGLGPITKA